MNDWDNTQAHVEGWQLHAPSGTIMAYGWEFINKTLAAKNDWNSRDIQGAIVDHITERAQAGSAYHIEALARHYFRET